VTYRQQFGDWYLLTSLDLFGKSQFDYSQRVTARRTVDNCFTELMPGMNLLNWCESTPTRDLITEDEFEGCSKLCRGDPHTFSTISTATLDGFASCYSRKNSQRPSRWSSSIIDENRTTPAVRPPAEKYCDQVTFFAIQSTLLTVRLTEAVVGPLFRMIRSCIIRREERTMIDRLGSAVVTG